MKNRAKWAFVLDKDQFVRLSLNKILRKYGFEVEEVQDFSELDKKGKQIGAGVILADVEIDVLEQWLPLLRRWNERFVLMTPLVTDELSSRLKQIGVHHILKKPVEPRLLKKVIHKISPPEEGRAPSSGKKREGSGFTPRRALSEAQKR